MELNPLDFYPGYNPDLYRCQRRQSYLRTACTHFLTILATISICALSVYVYDANFKNKINLMALLQQQPEHNVSEIMQELKELQTKVETNEAWKKHLEELFTSIYVKQIKESNNLENAIQRALEVYDSDKIGLYDYASIYACGSIVSIPETDPYPANKTMSFFSLVSMDLMSNPESAIQPGNLPGNCFAFHGSKGRIRIKLGKRIQIRAVTLEHPKYTDDVTSAPKNFEVYGIEDVDDEIGVLLGRFQYKLFDKVYQTFNIDTNNESSVSFEFVELHILSNHGKEEYTCVYRFRVHDKRMEGGVDYN